MLDFVRDYWTPSRTLAKPWHKPKPLVYHSLGICISNICDRLEFEDTGNWQQGSILCSRRCYWWMRRHLIPCNYSQGQQVSRCHARPRAAIQLFYGGAWVSRLDLQGPHHRRCCKPSSLATVCHRWIESIRKSLRCLGGYPGSPDLDSLTSMMPGWPEHVVMNIDHTRTISNSETKMGKWGDG